MKRKKSKTKKKNFLGRAYGFGIIFVVVFIVFLKMYQMFTVDLIMKDMMTLRQQKIKLESETARLETEVSRLKNIDRISEIARTKLNMIRNNEDRPVLELKDYSQMKKLAQKYSAQKKTLNLAGVQ
jgi:cell division protein FtsL